LFLEKGFGGFRVNLKGIAVSGSTRVLLPCEFTIETHCGELSSRADPVGIVGAPLQ
jgi:hypothetical protein